MWKKLTVNDTDLERIANIRNISDCTASFDKSNIIHYINHKTDCNFYYYEDKDYEILIGFKIHNGFNKITYVSYAIGKFGDIDYYKQAFRIIGEKTREYLIEKNNTLIGQTEGMGEGNKTAAFLGGLQPFLELIKIEYDKCGVKVDIDYNNNFLEMSVDGNWDNPT